MGNPRLKPDRLPEKLRQIRNALALSQTQMLRHLGLEDAMHYSRISEYEQGTREPTLMTLLAYTHAAGVHMEDIVDDTVDLPDNLPGPVKFLRLKRARAARRRR
jgi:transcriptional regulator with XRE-family HTH domain